MRSEEEARRLKAKTEATIVTYNMLHGRVSAYFAELLR